MVTLTVAEQHSLFAICAPYRNCLKARLVNPVEIDGQLRTINASMKCEIWKKIHSKFCAKHPRHSRTTVKEIQVYYGCWKQKSKMLLQRLARGETLYEAELDSLKASGVDLTKFKTTGNGADVPMERELENLATNDTESASTITDTNDFSIEAPLAKQEIEEIPTSSFNDDTMNFRNYTLNGNSNDGINITPTPFQFNYQSPITPRPLCITDALNIVDFCQNKDLKFEMNGENLVFRPREPEEDKAINIPIQLFKELGK
ncbi:unnamed protein product [Bursaphelenchus xylophilus]|uniref:(pine wood nematode) hypothetical protein n=1 Tax=Bursaphelenchus xylophilus TaxID=6326 RepID=A0A1I7S4T7_BURXY|nr:unnamed protein product [Bursaphelenchus xylophilus]CAG9117368.1 unnamed protein product [Bursaphelenchus xylophilus]